MDNVPSPTPDVAVLGLGIIGSIWAGHLASAGLLAASWNRTPKPDVPGYVADPVQAVAKAKTIILVLADPPSVDAVLDAIIPALGPGHQLIQSTTIGPSDSTRFQASVTATGATYLEAPFTGSKPAAEARRTIFYLGGSVNAVAAAEPTLAALSARRIHIGTGPQACVVKLAMNLQIAAQAEALCEALWLARQAGVSDDTFFSCMKDNASWSGLSTLKEPKLRSGDFSPQFSVKHLLKDLRLLEQAGPLLPTGELLITRLAALAAAGRQDDDFIALLDLAGLAV